MDDALRSRLSASPLFGGLRDEQLAVVCALLRPREVAAGEVVLRAGELGCELFYLFSGAVEVVKGPDDEVVARLGPGDCFGEMALLEAAPRSASVRASCASVLYGLRTKELHGLQRSEPQVFLMMMMNLARELSRRLRRADEEIARVRGLLKKREVASSAAPAPECAAASGPKR